MLSQKIDAQDAWDNGQVHPIKNWVEKEIMVFKDKNWQDRFWGFKTIRLAMGERMSGFTHQWIEM